MSTCIELAGPVHAGHIDDEILALTLQQAEIADREANKKGKYSAHRMPDLEVAFADYLVEVESQLQFLQDLKLAHSIANAVNADAQAIAELSEAETQASQHRQVAVQLDSGDTVVEPPPPYTVSTQAGSVQDQLIRGLNTLLAFDEEFAEKEANVAGPSVPYARRQADAIEKLGREDFQCTACTEYQRWTDVTRLSCEHDYCGACLKAFIMRGVNDHDLGLIPPRCCGVSVPHAVILNALNEEEMSRFQDAETEKSTSDKTYCSKAECGKFIAPAHIEANKAICFHCKSDTCNLCKNAFHHDDCPADLDLQATLQLGTENGWQRCFSCRSLVAINTGCNHMVCRCGAEFCYLCGRQWSTTNRCNCAFWLEENLLQRAEQVVDRAAPNYITPAERLRRIAVVQEDLRDTDECDHRGKKKFERISGGHRSRFECEMCNARHRQFILRCRRCQLDVCMDCRLHRV